MCVFAGKTKKARICMEDSRKKANKKRKRRERDGRNEQNKKSACFEMKNSSNQKAGGKKTQSVAQNRLLRALTVCVFFFFSVHLAFFPLSSFFFLLSFFSKDLYSIHRPSKRICLWYRYKKRRKRGGRPRISSYVSYLPARNESKLLSAPSPPPPSHLLSCKPLMK